MSSDNARQNGKQKSLSPLRRSVKVLEEFINAGMEKFVTACPRPIMAIIAQLLFWPTLWWNQLLRKEGKGSGVQRNWYDRVQPNIILGALPYAKIVPKLKEEGVTDVLNMVAEWEGPVREYEAQGMRLRRIPVIDFTPPSLHDIEEAADFLHQVVEGGGTAYVHCKAGRGRSASVVMGYLIKYRGLTPAQAQRALIDARPHVLHMLDQREVIKQLAVKCGQ